MINHEIHEIHERGEPQNDALVLDFWIVAEVHEEAEFIPRCTKVVMDLRAVFIKKLRDRFYLKNDFPKANEIWNISLLKFTALILHNQSILATEFDFLN